MVLSPTNRYMNTTTCTWTPSGGSLVTLTGIKSISVNEGMEALQESADADVFPTVGGVIFGNPSVTLHTIDAFAIYATVGGTKGSFAYTANDFTNAAGAGGGAKTTTFSNSFLASRSREHPHKALGSAQIMFHTTSTDGTTNPMAVTAV